MILIIHLCVLCLFQAHCSKLSKSGLVSDSRNPRFIQSNSKNSVKTKNPDLMSLLFHGPVTPRNIAIGLEDSNKPILNEIKYNEEMNDVERKIQDIEESEQNQLEAVDGFLSLENREFDAIESQL
ncbi:hypothetical protein BdWA1_002797 [Babesia duncani]|uniref:Uncharacterized protein n=1 Tax=Babesia duncani TaxID=323732 RepID=A0AAD9UNU0_9APIC|nr:hypothetical protein BdWA1_002797 [Babesia duncani]